MTILDPCMSLEWIKKILGVSGVVDMRQILLKSIDDLTSFFGQSYLCFDNPHFPFQLGQCLPARIGFACFSYEWFLPNLELSFLQFHPESYHVQLHPPQFWFCK